MKISFLVQKKNKNVRISDDTILVAKSKESSNRLDKEQTIKDMINIMHILMNFNMIPLVFVGFRYEFKKEDLLSENRA
ncbi:hypothetical protein [Staphylococcus shinii]|uniref:hypothetical protein n=1 Tax=Staphylococcus shinii TaxID=2912228 RepID=UPI000C3491D7|nr:hypothetical protein [Staphylococcus shinii]PKI11433.1 hypothetical protein CW743_13745 [Staphylococcus shinii]